MTGAGISTDELEAAIRKGWWRNAVGAILWTAAAVALWIAVVILDDQAESIAWWAALIPSAFALIRLERLYSFRHAARLARADWPHYQDDLETFRRSRPELFPPNRRDG